MKILLQGIAQLILPLLIGLVFLECKKDESVKFYQEIEILKTNPMDEQAPMHHSAPPVSDAPVSRVAGISWALPPNWEVTLSSSGMRLATFITKEDTSTIECSLVQLEGSAGGINSNIERWLQQLSIILPSGKDLSQYIQDQQKISTQQGTQALIIDFTSLLSSDIMSNTSMIAAMIEVKGQTIFLKATGNRKILIHKKQQFLELVRSISIGST